jgi:hypothetical protein
MKTVKKGTNQGKSAPICLVFSYSRYLITASGAESNTAMFWRVSHRSSLLLPAHGYPDDFQEPYAWSFIILFPKLGY